jgi:FAD/FMN-containing dehydrogenase
MSTPKQRSARILRGPTPHRPASENPDSNFVDLARAVAAWRSLLGEDAVVIDKACRRWEENCIGVDREIPVVLRPRSEKEVTDIVGISARFQIPLYPVSTGKNWGYGSATPAADRCVVVDLSNMNEILALDPDLGLLTVQPGVTQGQLRDYLDDHDLPFMVPVTGAGPACSLMGNALERGYGITPHSDHFAAVRSVRAVLADGSVYRSALADAGGERVDAAHKWGVGPYLDGLYSQGGFGIVTQMTIALAPMPARFEAFLFDIDDPAKLGSIVDAVRELMRTCGGSLSGVNLMNRVRVLSMTESYPHDRVDPGEALPAELVEELSSRRGLPEWLGLGAIYGEPEVIKGLRKVVKRTLGKHSRRVRFLNTKTVRAANAITRILPSRLSKRLTEQVDVGQDILDIVSGRPRETALKLAYWTARSQPPVGSALDPARDGRGVLWFAPLVPMTAADVEVYVKLAKDICPRFGFDPMVTLTTVSEHCFDSTIPLLYELEEGPARADACYRALFDACRVYGFLPYRMNVNSMALYTDDTGSTYWNTVGVLKKALDPDNLIAPGRYAPSR